MSERIRVHEFLVGYREGMSCLEDLETLKDWLEWRMWSVCSELSSDRQMDQKSFALASGLGQSTVSDLVNRKDGARLGDETWPKVADFFRLTPERAFAQARRWGAGGGRQRWKEWCPPDEELPPASTHLLAAVDQLRQDGLAIGEPVVEFCRRMTRQSGDRPVEVWTGILKTFLEYRPADLRALMQSRDRLHAATDHPDPSHEGRLLLGAGSKRRKKR
jgi:hypothetical protein